MERVFSVEGEEIPNPFWSPSPSPAPVVVQPPFVDGGLLAFGGVAYGDGGGAMDGDGRTEEWGLQKFVEDAVLHADGGLAAPLTTANQVVHPLAGAGSGSRSTIPEDDGGVEQSLVKVIPAPAAPAASEVADPVAYNAMLRRKLDEDLAAVAMWKVSGCGGSAANHVQNEGVNVISSSSGGSDDDMERDTTAIGDMNVSTAHKAKRRKESNRDSARRSRSRKAAYLREMEEQLSDLKVENSSLMRRLSQVVQKYNNSAVDCRVLKAKVETLETKLKMAENNLTRATGTTNMAQAMSVVSSLTTPFAGAAYQPDSIAGGGGMSVPIQETQASYFAAAMAATQLNGNSSYIVPARATSSAFHAGDFAAAAAPPFATMGQTFATTVLDGGRLAAAAAVSRPPWAAAPAGGFE